MTEAASLDEFRTLLVSARQGSREALGGLFALFRAYLLAVADGELDDELRAKGSGADLVQDAFLEAQEILERFRGDRAEEFQAWLRAVLLNKLREFRQRYQRTQSRQVQREKSLQASDLDLPSGDSTVITKAARSEQAAVVLAALARLPEDQQNVIRWRNWEKLTFVEIGQRLGKSEDAARMIWGRAVARLEQELGGPLP